MRRVYLLLSFLLSACAPAPDAESAIAEAQSRYTAALAAGDSPAAAANAAVGALAASPAFQATGAEDEGTVWGQYQDGGLFMLVFADGDGPAELPGLDVTDDLASQSSALTVFDSSASFQIFNTFDQSTWHSGAFADNLRTQLTNKGFHDVSTPFTTTSLRGAYYTNGNKPNQLAGSLLYFGTHGGKNGMLAADPDEKYVLWTGETANLDWKKDVTARSDNPYFGHLPAGVANPYNTDFTNWRIVEMAACSKFQCAKERHWGISDRFVSKYLKTETNSVVYADGCASFTHDSAPMTSAFKAAGAGAYIGWNDTVQYKYGVAAMYAITGLWLSADYTSMMNADAAKDSQFDAPPTLQLPPDNSKRPRPLPPTPLYPPMDLSSAFSYLAVGATAGFPMAGTARMQWKQLGADTPQLAPGLTSIGSPSGGDDPETHNGATIDPLDAFPSMAANAQLAVTVGGAATTCAWKARTQQNGGGSYFQCTIPNSAAGDVVLTMGGAQSNAIPLTEWRGALTYSANPTGPMACPATITANLHLRVDVHQARQYDPVRGDFPPAQNTYRSAFVAPDSTVNVTFGGNCTGTVAVPYWDQTMQPQTRGPQWFLWFLNWDSSTKAFTQNLSIAATATYTDPITNVSTPAMQNYGAPALLFVDPTDYSIKAGSSADTAGTGKTTWPKISPTKGTAPTAATAS